MKLVLIRCDLCKSPIITLRLYFLGIFKFQGVANLVSFKWTDVIKTAFWNSKLVSRNLFGFSSDGNYLRHWTKDLLGFFYGDWLCHLCNVYKT